MGQAFCIPLIRLHLVHLRLRNQVGRNDDAVYAILGEVIKEVEAFEPRFVDKMDRAFGELMGKILYQCRILCLHRCLVDYHLLVPYRNLPCLLRILESHKNLFTFDYEILYLTYIHPATSPFFDLW